MMKLIQEGEVTGGKFIMLENEEEAGKVIYTWRDNSVLVIEHTIVSPRFKGKNIGTRLVMEVADFARKEQLKIISLCPFARSVFEKNQEIQDLLIE